MKKKILIGLVILLGLAGVGYGTYYFWPRPFMNPFSGLGKNQAQKLEKYDFDNLRARGGIASTITIGNSIKAVEDRRKSMKLKYKNNFTTREISYISNGKKISGMINYYPERSSLSPVIIMIRGYAEPVGYYLGSGTWHAADYFADAGYATISLDFLGYADSDAESSDVLEARFEKVESVMDLIESVKQLPWVDKNRIGIWAHSNGGQIALSVLEVSGANYPTALWAPMTNPFPQSLIDTADPGEDRQKAEDFVNLFLKHYDGRRYAFENYYSWITAPVMIQQGTNDVWCKVEWQQNVVDSLKSLKKEANLVVYPGDDHNLSKSWEQAVEKDLDFYVNKFSISI